MHRSMLISRAARITLIVVIILLAENGLILATPYAIQAAGGWSDPAHSYLAEVLMRQVGYVMLGVVVVLFFGPAAAAILCLVIVAEHMLLPLAAVGMSGPVFLSLAKWHDLLAYLSAAVAGASVGLCFWQTRRTRP